MSRSRKSQKSSPATKSVAAPSKRPSAGKTPRKRTQYSAIKRRQVLAVAAKEHLTANQVQKRFGVKPVTYYSWRRKGGVARARRGRPRAGRSSGAVPVRAAVSAELRRQVKGQIATLLPGIIRSEVASALGGRRRSG